MSPEVVYEIARYKVQKNSDPVLLERLQLIAQDGALRLRDTEGNEIPCKETDIASAIGAMPALRKVPKRQQALITCGEELLGQLPELLEPISDGASLFVNDKAWDAFPTLDSGDVMLPGENWLDAAPEMNPCWAEYRCAEGGRNFEEQLVGFSSIGLLAPGIAIEHGRTEYGGNGGAVAVSITPFDDFATIFIEWLLRTPILSGFWQGYRYITTPDVDLFAKAAVATDRQGYWEDDDTADEADECDEDEDEDADADADDEDSNWEDEGSFASRCLELHLTQELINEVRAHLSAMCPKYAAALVLPGHSPEPD